MKKATKRLMMVVAILLCLVLISTSVVSGVFARFVIQKSASTSVGFTNFGITVDLVTSGLTQKSKVLKGDTVTATYNEITLKPSDDFSEAFKITIDGTPKVKTLITVDVVIDYDVSKFQIPTGKFDAITSATNYIPVGFKVNNAYASATVSSKTQNATPFSSHTDTVMEEIVERTLAAALGLDYSDGKMTKTIGPDETVKTITKTNIPVGFDWPADYDGVTNSNEIGTYLSLHNTGMKITTFSIVVKAEQVIGN